MPLDDPLANPLFAERYRAIAARDRRFDGQFITAVRSTGIYCRPSCPARTPLPGNVTFYDTSAAAHAAGYRACKRCLPEATPGTPAWDARHDLASRAMRLVRDGLVDREGVEGLSSRLGYTSRHVHRVLVAELGASPLALARAQRAHTARALVVQTDLPLTDIAFAAGFGSIRQFNDTMREVFALTPTTLREGSRRHAPLTPGPPVPGGLLRLALPYRDPYDARGIVEFLAARAVPGVERADPDSLAYARTLGLPHGPGGFEARFEGGRLAVALELASLADLPVAVARIRHLFDLDADPGAVDAALSNDPALAPSLAATPGIRLPGAVDGEEILLRAVVGQQISVAAARTHLGRLADAYGAPVDSRLGLTRAFPTADRIVAGGALRAARGEGPVLRGPARRLAAFDAITDALARGDVAVSRAADPVGLRAALLALPGVGPWTAGYVAMRVLHDPDVLLATDVALLGGAAALDIGAPGRSVAVRARALGERGERWSPWRSYASMHLWRAAAAPPSPRPVLPKEHR